MSQFQEIDADGDGYITAGELKESLERTDGITPQAGRGDRPVGRRERRPPHRPGGVREAQPERPLALRSGFGILCQTPSGTGTVTA
ncbi:hypothetical protein ACIHCQ_17940 [Streptomyces sp. NPDC052236]|uniref:hypothetical protein n=1 Tax=Streptomyces sp. NPDC052236 TaxID=3365686 RepID=UPI0037CE8618